MKRFLHLLIISLFPVIAFSQTFEEKQEITKDYNKVNLEEMAKTFKIEAEFEKQKALALAKQNGWRVKYEEDGKFFELMKVRENGTPVYYSTYNVNAALSSRAYTMHNGGLLGLNIEGQNMEAHVWDGGIARITHQEYDGAGGNNRFSVGDGSSSENYHSAHVTGTIIASGYVSSAKGMAPQADAIGYDWNSDLSEATSAANSGMLLSNHSYGWNILYVDDWEFGAYVSESRSWDNLMYNAPYYLMVVAAGNEGEDNGSNGNPLDGNQYYDKLNGHATSKNNMVVANAQDANINGSGDLISVSINSGSSEGPCDDYRIKPDITGNGTSLYSTMESYNSEYGYLTGTSMASPNVTGTLLLLQQHYNDLNSSYMRAATLKGLALHTADDAGPSGPDAIWGWGLINAKEAANTISDNGTGSIIDERTLTTGNSYQINVTSDGTNDLIASISWTDPPGTANTGTANDPTPALVNDLDITITKGGSTYYPYKLTSITSNVTGDNDVDPFEKIIISGASGTYTINVTYEGSLYSGSQAYSLIVNGISGGIIDPPIADFEADNLTPGVGQTVDFTDLSSNNPSSWSWTFTPSSVTYLGGTNSASQNPQVQFNSLGLYTVALTATNAYGNDTETKTDYIDVPLYCEASGASSFLEITRVQLETIDNSSAQEYYGDFTYLSTDLNKYHSYDITITNDGSIQNADLGIWIDYNQDGDFDDAGENIVCDIDNYGDGTFNFSIPGTALAGTTRMRIRTKFSGSDCGSPCGPESNGEVEDYSVNLIEAFPGLWTGASSTDWGVATNWDDTNIPVAVTNVTIPSSPSGANFPEINSGSGAVCNNLTIEAGAHVNIPSDNTLTVNGTLTNNSGISGLVIQSSVSGTGSLLHNTAGINGSVRQYLTDDEWHYVSIPTSNAMSYVFYDIWLKPFVESTYSWGDNILNNISLGIMQGYAAWTYDVATVSFEGPFNNGLQTIDVTRNTVTTNQGYNLVGNPYPSAVDWDITDGWDKTYVDNTIYFWKGVGGSGGTGNYYYHNGGLGEVPDVSLGYNDLEDNGIIPAMQGFFVRATTDGTFEVNNEARVHSDQTYYKDDAENTLPLIRLRSENSASLFDETIIRFYSGATPEHDGDYDAFKLEGYLVPQLYSITPEQSKLAINTSPAYENGTIIPIGFIAHIEDEYSISLAEFENFNIETEVYLEDLKENEIQNLSLTPNYVFNGSPEDAAQRFNLHFSNPMSVDDNIMGSQISIYSYSNVVYVQKPSNFDGNVFIYDILGKEIYSSKAQGGGLASIPVTNGNGYYLVKVQSNADIKTEKVYIK